MARLLIVSVKRYPSGGAELFDVLLENGKVVRWYPTGGSPREGVDHVIDLEERWLAPAFIDSHLHLLYTEQHSKQIDLSGLNLDGVFRALHENRPSSGPLVGHGWRDPVPDLMFPNPAQYLDDLFPHQEVLLWNADFHRVLVNSPILVKLQKGADHSGILVEEEAEAAWNLVKSSPESDVPGACRRLIRHGITAATTFDRGESIEAFVKNRPGQFGVTVRHGLPEEEFLAGSSVADFPIGNPGDDFAVRWVKIFVDGTLGSRTAWLKSDYSDDPGNRGVKRRFGDSLAATAREAGARGWGLALHAIGDDAVREAIRAIRIAQSSRSSNVLIKDRIEHLQLLDPADMEDLLKSEAVASLQPCHLFEDRNILRSRWGSRADHAIPFRELLDHGVPVISGTDAPIEVLDPWADLRVACDRKDRHGLGSAEGEHQVVSFQEAFYSKTAGAAEANYLANGYGTLDPGSQADFQVLESHPEKISSMSNAGLVQVYSQGDWRLTGEGALGL